MPAGGDSQAWLSRQRRAMEMDVPPPAILPLPDARFFHARRHGRSLRIQALVEPDIGDHGDVAHDSHLGGAHRRVVLPWCAAEVEIEAMKRQPFDELS